MLWHVGGGAVPKGHVEGGCHTGLNFKALAGYQPLSPGRLWLCVTAGRQRHWVHGCPMDDEWLLHVLWQAAESVSMTPALLELLLSHGRLPPSEPVAEHPCPQSDV